MTQLSAHGCHIGVWLEWPAGDVANAGRLARRTALLAIGAAAGGHCLHVAAPDALEPVLRARLSEIAGPEGNGWVLHSPGRLSAIVAAQQALGELKSGLGGIKLRTKKALAALLGGARSQAYHTQQEWIRQVEAEVEQRRMLATPRPFDASPPNLDASLGDVDAARFAADFCAHIQVDGWLVMSPDFSGGAWLSGSPRAVVVPDGSPTHWPLGWPDADWEAGGPAAIWASRAAHMLTQGDPVIVATPALGRSLGVSADRMRVVPPAPVDLASHVGDEAEGWALLSEEVESHRYLRGFPFKDVTYLAVWSEGVPGQNLNVLRGALRLLIQRDLMPIKAFLAVPAGAPEPEAWQQVREEGLHHDLVAMPSLSTAALGALLRGAQLGLYTAPSADGGAMIGWSQAICLGTPSLVCDGPDLRECLPPAAMEGAVFDPYDAEGLAELIKTALKARDQLAAHQKASLQDAHRTWASVFNDHLSALGLGAAKTFA